MNDSNVVIIDSSTAICSSIVSRCRYQSIASAAAPQDPAAGVSPCLATLVRFTKAMFLTVRSDSGAKVQAVYNLP